jgi:hypothetical protein
MTKHATGGPERLAKMTTQFEKVRALYAELGVEVKKLGHLVEAVNDASWATKRALKLVKAVYEAGQIRREAVNQLAVEVGYASAREIAGFYQVKRGGALRIVDGDMVEVTPAGIAWLQENEGLLAA